MPKYRTEDIRNLTLVGHTGAGKTTLIEALLAKSGKIGEAGTIERGNTTTDHDPLEKEFHHSLDTAIASFDFDGIHVNLIDTAGFPDFRGPTLTGMGATEFSQSANPSAKPGAICCTTNIGAAKSLGSCDST